MVEDGCGVRCGSAGEITRLARDRAGSEWWALIGVIVGRVAEVALAARRQQAACVQ